MANRCRLTNRTLQSVLELVGEAKWCRPTDTDDAYWVGLELKDTTRDNMERWCKVVHQLAP